VGIEAYAGELQREMARIQAFWSAECARFDQERAAWALLSQQADKAQEGVAHERAAWEEIRQSFECGHSSWLRERARLEEEREKIRRQAVEAQGQVQELTRELQVSQQYVDRERTDWASERSQFQTDLEAAQQREAELTQRLKEIEHARTEAERQMLDDREEVEK